MNNLVLLKLATKHGAFPRFLNLVQQPTRCSASFTMSTIKSTATNTTFWEKNKNLDRPISPHLGIYKRQITMTLSILHRATGIAAAAVLYTGGIGALFFTDISFPVLLPQIVDFFPKSLVVAGKTALGGSIIYHTLNGIRHLAWDVGYGFQLKHLYLSGYLVVALTAAGTFYVFTQA